MAGMQDIKHAVCEYNGALNALAPFSSLLRAYDAPIRNHRCRCLTGWSRTERELGLLGELEA